MINEDRLNTQQHEQILNDIVSDALEDCSSQSKPTAILLAGQRGAGKSRMKANALEQLNSDCVIVDPDKLRSFHPNYNRYQQENPKKCGQ